MLSMIDVLFWGGNFHLFVVLGSGGFTKRLCRLEPTAADFRCDKFRGQFIFIFQIFKFIHIHIEQHVPRTEYSHTRYEVRVALCIYIIPKYT